MVRYGYVGGKIKYEAQFKLLCPQDTPIFLPIREKEIIQHYGLNFSTRVCKQYHRDKNLEQNEYINERPT